MVKSITGLNTGSGSTSSNSGVNLNNIDPLSVVSLETSSYANVGTLLTVGSTLTTANLVVSGTTATSGSISGASLAAPGGSITGATVSTTGNTTVGGNLTVTGGATASTLSLTTQGSTESNVTNTVRGAHNTTNPSLVAGHNTSTGNSSFQVRGADGTASFSVGEVGFTGGSSDGHRRFFLGNNRAWTDAQQRVGARNVLITNEVRDPATATTYASFQPAAAGTGGSNPAIIAGTGLANVGALNVTNTATVGTASVTNNATVGGNLTVTGTISANSLAGTVSNNAFETTFASNRGEIDVKGTSGGVLDLGFEVSGRETNAGRIGYNAFANNALDVVGAGTTSGTRQIRLYDHVQVDSSQWPSVGHTGTGLSFVTPGAITVASGNISGTTNSLASPIQAIWKGSYQRVGALNTWFWEPTIPIVTSGWPGGIGNLVPQLTAWSSGDILTCQLKSWVDSAGALSLIPIITTVGGGNFTSNPIVYFTVMVTAGAWSG